MASKKIALVIGWGSVKCAAALGLLRVLQAEGIQVDLVAASGGGSIYASLLALGYGADEIVRMNQRLWTHEVTQQSNPRAILQILFPRLFKVREYFYLRKDDLVNERLKEALGEHQFSDTKIPLFITATDYQTGEQVVMRDGSLYDAVRASISLPLIFKPVSRQGRLLSDGYLSDPLPVGVALQEGANIILALGFNSLSNRPARSFSDYLLHLSGILSNNLLDASYSFYNLAHHSELIYIVPEISEDIHMFDTHRVPEIIAAGEAEGRKHLPYLKDLLGGAS